MLAVNRFGPIEAEIHLVVLTWPHANEPTGSAVEAAVTQQGVSAALGRDDVAVTFLGPIDPPAPGATRFVLPCDLLTWCRYAHIAGPANQVEFSYNSNSTGGSPAARRADACLVTLIDLRPDAVVSLHGDVGGTAPYLYAPTPEPTLEASLQPFGDLESLDVDWTDVLGPRTLRYFPSSAIGLTGSEAFGTCVPKHLRCPVVTLELPMFDWSTAPEARLPIHDAVGRWIADGGAEGGDRAALLAYVERALADRAVMMVPSESTAAIGITFLNAIANQVGTTRPRSAN